MRYQNPYGLRVGQRVKKTMGIPMQGVVTRYIPRDRYTDGSYRPPMGREKAVYTRWDDGTQGWSHRAHLTGMNPYYVKTSTRAAREGIGYPGMSRNPELLIVGNPSKRAWEKRLSVPERHQLAIARKTLTMPDAMVGVVGGPTKAEAREIIRRYESVYGRNPGGRRRPIGKNPELLIVGNPPPKAFDVYLRGRKINTVFYGRNSMVTADEVRWSLINHDGYDPGIVVRQSRKGRNPMRKRCRSRNSWKGHRFAHRKAALKGWRKRSRKSRKGARKAYKGKMVIRYKGQRIGKRALIKKLRSTKKANKIWSHARKMKAK